MQSKITNSKDFTIYKAAIGSPLPIPAFLVGVQAGFPSPADDYIEKQLDLNDLVVKHPTATFFVRVEGNSMRDAGILPGDIIVVDRSLEAAHDKIVVAVINSEFTVKRIKITPKGICLASENPAFPNIEISPECEFQVWGVVTYIIHKAN